MSVTYHMAIIMFHHMVIIMWRLCHMSTRTNWHRDGGSKQENQAWKQHKQKTNLASMHISLCNSVIIGAFFCFNVYCLKALCFIYALSQGRKLCCTNIFFQDALAHRLAGRAKHVVYSQEFLNTHYTSSLCELNDFFFLAFSIFHCTFHATAARATIRTHEQRKHKYYLPLCSRWYRERSVPIICLVIYTAACSLESPGHCHTISHPQ